MVVGDLAQEVDLLVIGGGPGGYVAALRRPIMGSRDSGGEGGCAGRRLPAGRLHPEQGALACGQDHRRGGPCGGLRRKFFQADDGRNQASRLEEQRHQKAGGRREGAAGGPQSGINGTAELEDSRASSSKGRSPA